ncbi:hypothetical protein BDW75DRAFT_216863 [Aspergillus navahoensis]
MKKKITCAVDWLEKFQSYNTGKLGCPPRNLMGMANCVRLIVTASLQVGLVVGCAIALDRLSWNSAESLGIFRLSQ